MTNDHQLSLTTEWVDLTEAETIERGAKLANLIREAALMADEHAERRKDMKEEREALDGQIALLAATIRKRDGRTPARHSEMSAMAKSGLPPGVAASGIESGRSPAAAGLLPAVQTSGPASALPDGLTISEAAATLTLDDAVRVARSIQRDLEAGRLHVPYPPAVRRSLLVSLSVFGREGDSPEKAAAIIARLEAQDDPADIVVTPAWA